MKTWFITGTSKGFGRVWAEAALAQGDQVVATARQVERIADLRDRYPETALSLALDVTDRGAVAEAVSAAIERFGRIDVVINNAGYGLFGAVEEASEDQARAQLETNVFGALWVTQAVLPIMRAQRSGHIIQISSIGGVVAFGGVGLYNASKWALEGFSEALSQEVAGFGIAVTIVEPGAFGTDWGTRSAAHTDSNPAYQPLRDAMAAARTRQPAPGDPEATGRVMLELVGMETPPLRIMLGRGVIEQARAAYRRRVDTWEAHRDLAERAQGDSDAQA